MTQPSQPGPLTDDELQVLQMRNKAILESTVGEAAEAERLIHEILELRQDVDVQSCIQGIGESIQSGRQLKLAEEQRLAQNHASETEMQDNLMQMQQLATSLSQEARGLEVAQSSAAGKRESLLNRHQAVDDYGHSKSLNLKYFLTLYITISKLQWDKDAPPSKWRGIAVDTNSKSGAFSIDTDQMSDYDAVNRLWNCLDSLE